MFLHHCTNMGVTIFPSKLISIVMLVWVLASVLEGIIWIFMNKPLLILTLLDTLN